LVEDAEHKQVVHDFMAILTAGINRKLGELHAGFTVTVDEVEFNATMPNKNAPIPQATHPAVLRLLYRDLLDSVK